MKRRDFIKSAITLSAFGSSLPAYLLGSGSRFSFRHSNISSDKIVIFVKMNGGNDGLNTLIPYQNSSYYDLRPSIAISNNELHPISDTLGFHPALNSWQELFDLQKMVILQGVGYQNGNLSHFRSSDIWDTGSSENVELATGWLGRLLETEYPNFPNNAPEHPLAIQYNSANLLEFKTNESNAGLYIYDPEIMESIITGNFVDSINQNIPDTYGGHELAFIKELDYMALNYCQILSDSAQNAPNTIFTYPTTNIGNQFKITSKLITGGLSTPFYRLYHNGYDTHVDQITRHQILLSELSSALSVFINEMDTLGLLDRILIVTTSEFGRRVYENGSGGTDHGTSAPLFIFGTNINSGVFGHDPDFNELDENDNPQIQFDYRQVYSSIITDWFGLDQSISNQVFNENFNGIPFINTNMSSESLFHPSNFEIYSPYPNPFNNNIAIDYKLLSNSFVKIRVYDIRGRLIKNLVHEKQNSGFKSIKWNATNNKGQTVSAGKYILRIKIGNFKKTKNIILLK